MGYLQFNSFPTSIFGAGCVKEVGEKVKALGGTKVLVVTDPNVAAAGIAKKVTDSLEASGIAYVVYDGVLPDPPAKCVNEAIEVGVAAGANAIVGVGGGSSMDTAKAASVVLSGFEGPAEKFVLPVPPMMNTTCPVILVPTTSGTGSEVTQVAVISRPEHNAKWSVWVNTSFAIIDPELTVTLPPEHTACTGLDALAHCIEGITNKDRNALADECCLIGIRKIADYLIRAYQHPDDMEARTQMSLAATFGGLGFKDPLTHVCHAMGDAYGCNFHTPHGQSCVFGLSATVKMIADQMPVEMKQIAEAMRIPLRGNETGKELGELIEKDIQRIMRAIGIKSQKELGFDRDKVIGMAQEVVDSHLSNHCPVKVTKELAEELLAYSYDSYQ